MVGMALDLTGCSGRMLHPADKSRPKLPQGPMVIVATADHRLSVMRLGNVDEEAAAAFESTCVKPALADVPAARRYSCTVACMCSSRLQYIL